MTETTVLIVDDEPAVCRLLSHWLKGAGCSCLHTTCAETVSELLRNREIQIAVLDVQLPHIDGLTLLRGIRETNPDIEVIMLTGTGTEKTVIRALNEGASAYLKKPCSRQDFLKAVAQAAQRQAERKTSREHTSSLEMRVNEQSTTIQRTYVEMIHRLVDASMYRDEETGHHIRRIGEMSAVLAHAAGWRQEDVETIRLAAPMHDVGKIGIPDAILQKPGRLTPQEMAIMQQHALIGASMLRDSNCEIMKLAETIALHHHEKWDGSGYPYGISGEQIPQAARIVAIVDVYDALTHDRVYRPAMDEVEALQIIEEGANSHFDATLVKLFFDTLDEIRCVAAEFSEEATPTQPALALHQETRCGHMTCPC